MRANPSAEETPKFSLRNINEINFIEFGLYVFVYIVYGTHMYLYIYMQRAYLPAAY